MLNFHPKVNSHWYSNQLIQLPAMQLEDGHALYKVCVMHALNMYLAAMKHLWKKTKSQQLSIPTVGETRANPCLRNGFHNGLNWWSKSAMALKASDHHMESMHMAHSKLSIMYVSTFRLLWNSNQACNLFHSTSGKMTSR